MSTLYMKGIGNTYIIYEVFVMNTYNLDSIKRVAKDVRYLGQLEESNINAISIILTHFEKVNKELYDYYNKFVLLGMKQKDIAEELGCKNTKVSRRVCSARAYMKEYFMKYRVEDGYNPEDEDSKFKKLLEYDNLPVQNNDLSSVGIKSILVREFNQRGIYTKSDLKKFILSTGPNWTMYVSMTEARATIVENNLNIDWSEQYSDLENLYDIILDDIGYSNSRTDRTYDMLKIILNYYKQKHFLEFDLYYRYLTDFDWASIFDEYGTPKYAFHRRQKGFLKYIGKPEMLLLLYKGISEGEVIRNYKVFYMAKLTGYNVTIVRDSVKMNTPLSSLNLSSRAKSMLQEMGWTTYGEVREGISRLGEHWYLRTHYQRYYVDEIEFMLYIK